MELFEKFIKKFGALFLLTGLLALVFSSTASAQEPATTRLFFNPAVLTIDTELGTTGVVSLEVADGVDLFAFDIQISYDAELLQITSIERGPFLPEAFFCVDQVNDPGLFHYSCTKFGVDYGDSGSGVLFVLTFEALGAGGESALSLEGSELYDWPNVLPVGLVLEDGTVEVLVPLPEPEVFWVYLPVVIGNRE